MGTLDKRVYFGGQFIQFILKGHSLLKINKLYLIHGGGPVLYSSYHTGRRWFLFYILFYILLYILFII